MARKRRHGIGWVSLHCYYLGAPKDTKFEKDYNKLPAVRRAGKKAERLSDIKHASAQ